MASVKIKYIMEDVVVLVKGHMIQENEDGTEKYLQESNIEIPLEEAFSFIKR